MAHKTRADQFSHSVKTRKDPKGLAKKTKAHDAATRYQRDPKFRKSWDRVWELLEGVDDGND